MEQTGNAKVENVKNGGGGWLGGEKKVFLSGNKIRHEENRLRGSACVEFAKKSRNILPLWRLRWSKERAEEHTLK